MKYFAIFKDSLREAIDAKLLYVTVALSLLVSLLVMTMTLTPVPVDEASGTVLGFFNMMLSHNKEESKKIGLGNVERLETGDFKRLNAGTEPWTGDYQFTLTAHLWAEADDDKGKPANQALETSASMMIVPWSQTIRVKELDMPDRKTARYMVTTSGAKNQVKTREEWIHQAGLFFGLLPLPHQILVVAGSREPYLQRGGGPLWRRRHYAAGLHSYGFFYSQYARAGRSIYYWSNRSTASRWSPTNSSAA